MNEVTHNLTHEQEPEQERPAFDPQRLRDMVEEEAARAETPDDEPEPVPEPEPDPEEPTPELRAAYADLLAEYLPPDIALTPCPLCASSPIPGAIPFEIRPDPNTQTCEQCGGTGEVTTGSYVPHEESRQCKACVGAGYTELVANVAVPPQTPISEAQSAGGLGYEPITPPIAPALTATG